MTNKDKERLRELAYLFFGWLNNNIKPSQQLLIDKQAILSLIDSVPSEEVKTFIGILNNNKLADAIARDCHDKLHDERWCGTCEIRESAIFDYRESIRKALNMGEEEL